MAGSSGGFPSCGMNLQIATPRGDFQQPLIDPYQQVLGSGFPLAGFGQRDGADSVGDLSAVVLKQER